MSRPLTQLREGQELVFGGDQVTVVSAELAEAFHEGDRLVIVQETGDLLHIPRDEHAVVCAAVTDAVDAFDSLARCSDDQITAFFECFARRIDDDAFAPVMEANAADVESASARDRSTTRLELTAAMRSDMAAGLRTWAASPTRRQQLIATHDHHAWSVSSWRAPLGAVGFVFEGRPNVFADATGVLRTGNTAVFRIGSDALGTAQAIMRCCVTPARCGGRSANRLCAAGRCRVARRGVGVVLRSAAGLGGRTRLGNGGRPARCRCSAARCASEPARHGRRVDRGVRARRYRRVGPDDRALPRSQGVQHDERLLPAALAICAVRRRGHRRRRTCGRQAPSPGRGAPCRPDRT